VIDTLAIWHEIADSHDVSKSDSILAEDAVFISPVVHTPQKGRAITKMYLHAAMKVLANDTFRYTRTTKDQDGVIMEFETQIDDVFINGVDMVKWNEDGLITEFKVMVRPLQAVNKLHQMMGEMLQQLGQKPPK
jgi:hypothetical protein